MNQNVEVADRLLRERAGNEALVRVERNTGLDAHVISAPGHRGPVSPKPLATTVEAVIGAIYLSSGKDLATVRAAMVALGLIEEDAA